MVSFTEMYASQLIGTPVVDRHQEPLGKVKDVLLDLSEPFPKVAGLLVGEKIFLIGEIDLIGTRFVATKTAKDRIAWTDLRERDVLLLRDILDQQIVDLEGARVIRVTDLKLAKVDQYVRLIAVDVGLGAMLRRLGLEKPTRWIFNLFRAKVPEQLIGWEHVQSLQQGELRISSKKIGELHPADVAQIISQLKSDDKRAIFSVLSDHTAAEALHELEPMLATVLIANIDTKKAQNILDKMPLDEAADILGDLPPEKTEELLRLMSFRKAKQIQDLLKYKDKSAGGLMKTEFLTLSQTMTAEQVIQHLRETMPPAETAYYLYIVNEAQQLVGVLSLRNLIVAKPETVIAEIMNKDVATVSPETGQRQVAQVISKYNLLAVPVTDQDHKLLGVVTVDDVMNFIMPPFSRRKRQMLG